MIYRGPLGRKSGKKLINSFGRTMFSEEVEKEYKFWYTSGRIAVYSPRLRALELRVIHDITQELEKKTHLI